jgi:hypothetical protein
MRLLLLLLLLRERSHWLCKRGRPFAGRRLATTTVTVTIAAAAVAVAAVGPNRLGKPSHIGTKANHERLRPPTQHRRKRHAE